ELLSGLAVSRAELKNALDLMFDEPSVLDRFENTGVVTAETAKSIGLVGVAARASGLGIDARRDLPGLLTSFAGFTPEVKTDGDVFSRAAVRRGELRSSLNQVESILSALPDGDACAGAGEKFELKPESIAVSVVEAWRGEMCYTVITDSRGMMRQVKIVDPSFHNWFGLAMALRGQQISDFPICNKSFNLSYCGHDL
ncbi:MAG: hypothetical protein PHI35_09230, partial [Victivallaceae bacterium]|nr:hypothetical protein [Victivallaceae bacterium]